MIIDSRVMMASLFRSVPKNLFKKIVTNIFIFIAWVTSHIPDKGQVMVRHYGLYANAHRGKVKKTSLSPSALRVAEEKFRRIPSKGWAEMIRKVYKVDPMVCPKCGSFAVVDRIIYRSSEASVCSR